MDGDEFEKSNVAKRHREFKEAIDPLIKLKCEVVSKMIPNYIVTEDGKFETQYNPTPEQEKVLKQIDELIETLRSHILFGQENIEKDLSCTGMAFIKETQSESGFPSFEMVNQEKIFVSYVCSKCGSFDYDSFSTATGKERAFCRKCNEMVDLKEG